MSPVKMAALELGLPVEQPERVRNPEFVDWVRTQKPDALAVASFGQILPKTLLETAPPVNLHGSLLPRWRGAAPVQYALMHGDRETGVTTMWMDTGLDTGDILLSVAAPILPEDDYGTLLARLAVIGAPILMETLDRIEAGTYVRIPQDPSLATMSPSITPQQCRILWSRPAQEIVNLARALSPRPGAFADLQGREIKVFRAAAEGAEGPPGTVLSADRSGVLVAAGMGSVRLQEVQPSGGRRMSAGDWARGARIAL
jgi:methionyl-tRNA formyltransferase